MGKKYDKLKHELDVLGVVVDALVTLLHKKDVVKRDEIQFQILETAGEDSDDKAKD